MKKTRRDDPLSRPAVGWGLGCLLSAVAGTGFLLLVLIFAILLQPPPWIQVVVGVALVLGSAIFAWLLAKALTSDRPTAPQSEEVPRRESTQG